MEIEHLFRSTALAVGLMEIEHLIRSSPRRRALHSIAEGFSPTASTV
jgi:hypothetical protein